MTTPQLEDGFTMISNKIIEALAGIRISGEEMQCLWVILRKTYGWNKKTDDIALSQFSEATGISKPHTIRALKKLISKNIIVAKKGNGKTQTYRFNKDYRKWKALPKKATLPKKETAIAKKGNLALPKMEPTKDTLTKDRIPYCGFAEMWNKTVSGNLPKIRKPDELNVERKKAILKAWKDLNSLDKWREVFQALSDSPHHQGRNDRGWVADFDWIIKPKNYPRFFDKYAMPKIKTGQVQVGAQEERKWTDDEEELHSLRRQRSFAQRGNAEELKPGQVERLEALERATHG